MNNYSIRFNLVLICVIEVSFLFNLLNMTDFFIKTKIDNKLYKWHCIRMCYVSYMWLINVNFLI